MFLVISYDVVEDKRRVRLHKLLKDFGKRVQYSVFECEIDDIELEFIKKRIKRLIDLETDSVKMYFICGSCLDKISFIGKPDEPDFADSIVV